MGSIIGNLMMTSGIFGMDPGTRKVPDDIVKLVVWAKDKSFKDAMNREWLEMFPDEHSRPARHTMMYSGFSGNVLIQCEIVAVLS